MVRMINVDFNNEMWVAENRVDEYLEAGHKLASDHVEIGTVEEASDQIDHKGDPEIAPAQKKRIPAKKTGKKS